MRRRRSGHRPGERGRLDARLPLQTVEQCGCITDLRRRVGVTAAGKRQLAAGDLLGIESKRAVRKRHEATEEKRRAREQHHRERNLRHDEQTLDETCPLRRRRAASFLPEGVGQVDPRALECRQEAEHERGDERRGEPEREGSCVDSDVVETWEIRRGECSQRLDA